MKFKIKRVFKTRSFRWEWMWTLYAKNGKKIATSGESYQNKQDCIDMINGIKLNIGRALIETEW